MKNERKILPVKNNNDKAKTYTEHIEKYNRAIESECYFEALLISYAMMEDRLRSYLYYIGCLISSRSYKFDNDSIRNDIKMLVNNYSGDKVTNLGISSITGKMRIVKSVQVWFNSGCYNPNRSSYLNELSSVIDTCGDTKDMLDTLEKIREWCDYRNEIIHALMNKNLDSLYTDLPKKAKDGIKLARKIDNHVNRINYHNIIRKSLKLMEN